MQVIVWAVLRRITSISLFLLCGHIWINCGLTVDDIICGLYCEWFLNVGWCNCYCSDWIVCDCTTFVSYWIITVSGFCNIHNWRRCKYNVVHIRVAATYFALFIMLTSICLVSYMQSAAVTFPFKMFLLHIEIYAQGFFGATGLNFMHLYLCALLLCAHSLFMPNLRICFTTTPATCASEQVFKSNV